MRAPWLAVWALLAPSAAVAQTATPAAGPWLFADGGCAAATGAELRFEARGAIAANVDAVGAIVVACTPGTPFSIGLGPGTGAAATTAARWLTGEPGSLARYTLYQDPGRTQLWGDTAGADMLSATGDGRPRDYPVYGRMPPQTVPAGDRGDAVAVTISY
jgi:spore coat protein U-like protein